MEALSVSEEERKFTGQQMLKLWYVGFFDVANAQNMYQVYKTFSSIGSQDCKIKYQLCFQIAL